MLYYKTNIIYYARSPSWHPLLPPLLLPCSALPAFLDLSPSLPGFLSLCLPRALPLWHMPRAWQAPAEATHPDPRVDWRAPVLLFSSGETMGRDGTTIQHQTSAQANGGHRTEHGAQPTEKPPPSSSFL